MQTELKIKISSPGQREKQNSWGFSQPSDKTWDSSGFVGSGDKQEEGKCSSRTQPCTAHVFPGGHGGISGPIVHGVEYIQRRESFHDSPAKIRKIRKNLQFWVVTVSLLGVKAPKIVF